MFRVNFCINRNLKLSPCSILSSINALPIASSDTPIARTFDRLYCHYSRCGSRKVRSSFPKFKKICVRKYSSNGDLPSHQRVTLPALSPTMEMGTIISWEKKEGDKLNEGDLLAEIETDKATMGFETPDEGYLAKILISAGSKDIPLGKLLCIIVENESDIAAFKDFVDSEETNVKSSPPAAGLPPPPMQPPPIQPLTISTPTSSAPPPKPSTISVTTPAQPGSSPAGRIFASPLAKKLASEKGIELMNVQGTGPLGRIRAQDLDHVKVSEVKTPQAPLPPSVTAVPGQSATFLDIPVSAFKQEAARQALQSKQSIPHYYLTVDIEMDKLLSLKDELNDVSQKDNGPELSVTDLLLKATALACQKIPEANSSWQQTFIRQ
ncbi:DLAT [Nymphon striatum]|nr:DLAT [Nymphon striatum]